MYSTPKLIKKKKTKDMHGQLDFSIIYVVHVKLDSSNKKKNKD